MKRKKKAKKKKTIEGLPTITGCLVLARCVSCSVSLQFHGQWNPKKKKPVEYLGGKCPECGAINDIWFSPKKHEKMSTFVTSRTFNISVQLPDDKKAPKSKKHK